MVIAQNVGAARRQVENASAALSVPVTDLKIALAIGTQPPVTRQSGEAPAALKDTLNELKLSARQDRSLADALRFLLLARYYGEAPGRTLALAEELARESKNARNIRIARILGRDIGEWTEAEAREMLSAELGPAALLAAGDVLQRHSSTAAAAACRDRLKENTLAAQLKMAASSVALLAVMLGGASVWMLYSAARRRQAGGASGMGARTLEARAPGYSGAMWQTFALYLVVFLILAAAVAAAVQYGPKAAPGHENTLELVHYAVTATAIFCLAPLLLRRRELSLRDLGWASSDRLADIAWGIGGFMAATSLVVVLQMMTGLVLSALGAEPSEVTSPAAEFLVGARFGWRLALLLVVVGVIAPLTEETFFRGALLAAAGSEWGRSAGVFVSTLAFAAIHPGIPEMLVPYLGIGYVLGKLAVIRRSLLPCVIAHSLNNLFFVGMVMLLQL